MRMQSREEEISRTVFEYLPFSQIGNLFFMLSMFIEAVQEQSIQISLFPSCQRLLFSLRPTDMRWRNSIYVAIHFLG